MEAWPLVATATAACVAGCVNALAGGGTLLTFPVLVAVGLPPVVANVTNTVALCPGYLGGAWAQRRDLPGLLRGSTALAAAAGGLVGSGLLLATSDAVFRAVVPWLLLVASGLLAVQEPLRRWLVGRHGARPGWVPPAVFVGAIYGGYFGAGLGVLLLAALGLFLDAPLPRVNALKQAMSLVINVTAAVFFVARADVAWAHVPGMALGALVGGAIGGRMAGRMRPAALRGLVVTAGVVVALVWWAKT